MDYLDPDKKRKHKQRILFGYFLFTIAIAMATTLLVFLAKGYYVDRNTGEFIQNGLVFIDSEPGGAKVTINNVLQRGTTDVRLVIPEGDYKVDLALDGYRPWTRSFDLDGGSLRKLTYAKLIPNELTSSVVLDLPYLPTDSLQSINKRWVVLADEKAPLNIKLIDIDQNTPVLSDLTLSASLFAVNPTGTLQFIDWTGNDNKIFASYTTPESVQYLMIDRQNPAFSINLTKTFGDKPYEISMIDRKEDQFFVYDITTKKLFKASITDGVSATPFVDSELLGYKPFGSDWLLYVRESGEDGLVEVRFRRGNEDIKLRLMKTSDKYLLELAKLGDEPVMAVASAVEGFAVVYHDPQGYLKSHVESKTPVPSAVLKTDGINDLSISSDSSAVVAIGPEKFASHEFESEKSITFDVEGVLDPGQEVRWLDGQHIIFSVEGVQNIVDFDGSNQYSLVESLASLGSYYSNAEEQMYTFRLPVVDVNNPVPAPVGAPVQMYFTNLIVQ